MWLLVFVLCVSIHKCTPQFRFTETTIISYQIAGIFDRDSKTQQNAFNESIYHGHLGDFRLASTILNPTRSNSYAVWRELCSGTDLRPIAVFGPQNAISDGVVLDQCAMANIPHIQATWQPFDPDIELEEEEEEEDEPILEKDEESSGQGESRTDEDEEEENNVDEEQSNDEVTNEEPIFKNITINFYPDPDEVSLAYSKVLQYYRWESFSALYEDDFGLLRIQKIISEHSKDHPIHLRKLDPDADNRNVFKDLTKYQDSNRFLLDCRADRILKYMNEAKDLKMVKHYQHYVLVTMDASIVAEQLTEFQSNITWLSITEYDKIIDPQYYLAPRVGKWTDKPSQSVMVSNFTLDSLIMEDVANHVLKALQSMEIEDFEEPTSNICDGKAEPWKFGAQLQNAILKTTTKGVTGNIAFDEKGKRTEYTLYVNEIFVSKRQTIGYWDSVNGTEIIDDRPNNDLLSSQPSSKHFIVISRKAQPYFFDKQKCDDNQSDCEEESGDEKYEGFSVDLVKSIFDILKKDNFNYTYEFFHDQDKGYGRFDTITKKWDGLIGDLLDKKADLAVCDLTITEDRKNVVDFSVPFLSLGISILYTKERAVPPEMFSFMNPYNFEVWMYTATAYFVVSIVLFVCARISPADWENPQPCDKDPEELENIWTFKNCTWLTMGSIMTQGCDLLPKAIGTRWVCGMWWFFAVIVCQTYIAQLSASMTSALADEPINSIEDLAKQTKIRYGAIEGGSTYDFFRSSKDKTYRKIFETMEENKGVYVTNNDIGEKRVLNSRNKYAFFMESSTIEYKQKRNCNLQKVGGELDSKDYGIAMPANSPFRSHINRAILRLKELTILDDIKAKWWDKKYGAIECKEEKDENDSDLEMENLIGAFIVLIVGQVFCLFITAAEFMNEIRNIVVREQVTHKEAIIQELRASLNFFQLQKPVLRNPSRAPSANSDLSRSESEKHDKRAAFIDNFLALEKEPQ